MTENSVGVNAWGWTPWGLPFAAGMALHLMDATPRRRWVHHDRPSWGYERETQEDRERAYPNNHFIQNAREADELISLHRLARSTPCHDRPEPFARMSGAYERPDGAIVQPHALWAMEQAESA
ncbi:MAG TPA: hypothetical protein VK595_11160 [Vicinamibacterales bacterium]|nr:hypothetical protein [Vicinamibacterales bacterium]